MVLGKAVRTATRPLCWLVACTVALTACDGAHTHQVAKQTPRPDPEWWLDTSTDAQRSLWDAYDKACPVQGLLSNEPCVRAKIVESFGKQNDAGSRCVEKTDTNRLFMCVVNLTTTKRIYQTMGVNPDEAIDWKDSFEAVNSQHRSMAARLISTCPDTAQADCIARELATMLGVIPEEARRCALTTDAHDLVRCGSGLIRIESAKQARRDVA